MMGDVVELNPAPQEVSEVDKQYLELERQQELIREQARLIRSDYG